MAEEGDITREDLERNLRRRLLAARLVRRWDREKLMEEVRVDEIGMTRIERGARLPSLPLLVRLAVALGVSVDWLLTGQPSLMTSTDAVRIEEVSGIEVPDSTGAIG